jgi:hypothetical protein
MEQVELGTSMSGNEVGQKDSAGSTPKNRKVTGRPRRLTLDQVLEAARAIGLEGLTMSAVARRLKVPMPVLYGYISGRDELVRLVTAEVSRETASAHDTGQHWSVYVAQTAVALHSFLTGPGQLVAYFLSGGLGPEVELDRAESWLEKMTGSGFAICEALNIQRQMGEIVVGGAVTVLHARALEVAGRPFADSACTIIGARKDELPLLATEREFFARREPVWHRTLVCFIRDLCAHRGETLDEAALSEIFEGSVRLPA